MATRDFGLRTAFRIDQRAQLIQQLGLGAQSLDHFSQIGLLGAVDLGQRQDRIGHFGALGQQIGRGDLQCLGQHIQIVEADGGDLVLVAIDPRRAFVLAQSHAISQRSLTQATQFACLYEAGGKEGARDV